MYCPNCGTEYGTSAVECPDCYVRLVETETRDGRSRAPRDDEIDDEVVYELDDWEPELLEELRRVLAREGIAHSWEGNRNLVVSEADSDRVEDLLDDLEFPDELEPAGDDEVGGDGGDDEERYDTISDLFVAADRLMHMPDDAALIAEMVDAVKAVEATPPPYGFVPEEWARIRGLGAAVRHDLETGADLDVVAGDARSLREVLYRYV